MKKNGLQLFVIVFLVMLFSCSCGRKEAAPSNAEQITTAVTTEQTTEEITTADTTEQEPETTTQSLIDSEDQIIRSAMEEDGFGLGDKLAAFIDEKYTFNGAYIPDQFRAQSPEEIGGFLIYKVTSSGCDLQLLGAYGYSPDDPTAFETAYRSHVYGICHYGSSYESVSYANYSQGDLNDCRFSFSTDNKNMMPDAEQRNEMSEWLEAQIPLMLTFDRLLAEIDQLNIASENNLSGTEFGFIGYDENLPLYTQAKLPQCLQLIPVSDAKYTMSYRSSWDTDSKEYKHYGMLDVPVEVLEARILDNATGLELADFTVRAYAPRLLTIHNGEPEKQMVKKEDILEAIKKELLDLGEEWPLEDESSSQ